MGERTLSTRTIKRLFAVSGNRCAMPNCREALSNDSTVLGEIAHICARSPGGPRYDPSQEDEERHGFSNLIVLCPACHTLIDADEKRYPAHELRRIKAEHEAQAAKGPRLELDDDQADRFRDAYINSVSQKAVIAGDQNHISQIGVQYIQTLPSPSHDTVDQLAAFLRLQPRRNRFKLCSPFRPRPPGLEAVQHDLRIQTPDNNHGNVSQVDHREIRLTFDRIKVGKPLYHRGVLYDMTEELAIPGGKSLIVPAIAVRRVVRMEGSDTELSLWLDGAVIWDGDRFLLQ